MNGEKSFGLNLIGITDSIESAGLLLYRKADFVIVDCTDLARAIRFITSGKRKHGAKLFAAISPCRKFKFNGKEKSALEAFAILYDLVDAFVVYNYDELDEDIDPMIAARRFCEQYRPIYINVPDNLSNDETDEVIAYSLFSNIDAIMLGNIAQLDHCICKASGALEFIFSSTPDEYEGMSFDNSLLKNADVSYISVKPVSKKCHLKAVLTMKRLMSFFRP